MEPGTYQEETGIIRNNIVFSKLGSYRVHQPPTSQSGVRGVWRDLPPPQFRSFKPFTDSEEGCVVVVIMYKVVAKIRIYSV